MLVLSVRCSAQYAELIFYTQMLLVRNFSGITVPVITGYIPILSDVSRAKQLTAGVIYKGQRYTPERHLFWCCRHTKTMLPDFTADKTPLLIEFADECTSALATGDDVIRFGASFLKSNDGVNTVFKRPCRIPDTGSLNTILVFF